MIIEAAIVGREIECGVLGGQDGARARASLPGEILVTDPRHTFYDFEAKYLDEAGVTLACPADLPTPRRPRSRTSPCGRSRPSGARGWRGSTSS